MEPAPICSHCKKTLHDWKGNIMVDNALFSSSRRITGMCLICKECTNRLDKSGEGDKFHHLWELSWIKESPMGYFATVMEDLMNIEYGDKWDHEAVREIGFYVSLRLPYDEAHFFIRRLNPSEDGNGGPYLTMLDVAHGKDNKHA